MFSWIFVGKCISARTDPNKTHVPFRDSKLTRLLQESLGGSFTELLQKTHQIDSLFIKFMPLQKWGGQHLVAHFMSFCCNSIIIRWTLVENKAFSSSALESWCPRIMTETNGDLSFPWKVEERKKRKIPVCDNCVIEWCIQCLIQIIPCVLNINIWIVFFFGVCNKSRFSSLKIILKMVKCGWWTGNAKTALVINIAPCSEYMQESLSSLQFGSRVKLCIPSPNLFI